MGTPWDTANQSEERALKAMLSAQALRLQAAALVRRVREEVERSRRLRRDRHVARHRPSVPGPGLRLPAAEILRVIHLMIEAVDLADQGRLVDGYSRLAAGLRRAEQIKEAGRPWADELIQRCQMALESYTFSYGVSME